MAVVKVKFYLPANTVGDAKSGVLLGDFNNWDENDPVNLKKEKDNSLTAKLKLKAGKTYQYRYLLDDGRWVNDEHGHQIKNCIITVPQKKKDDFRKIKGISKKIAPLLRAENIMTFEELSRTNIQKLQNILDLAEGKFKKSHPELWIKQATLAADDKWGDLKLLQKELKIKNKAFKSHR